MNGKLIEVAAEMGLRARDEASDGWNRLHCLRRGRCVKASRQSTVKVD